MLKFPYGIYDFRDIIQNHYFFIDRTDRIRLLETISKKLLFIRPRRFGKSLLVSMLENYYDVARAGEFDHDNPPGHAAIPVVRSTYRI